MFGNIAFIKPEHGKIENLARLLGVELTGAANTNRQLPMLRLLRRDGCQCRDGEETLAGCLAFTSLGHKNEGGKGFVRAAKRGIETLFGESCRSAENVTGLQHKGLLVSWETQSFLKRICL